MLIEIKGYEGLYSAHSDGLIWSHRKAAFLRVRIDRHGYRRVTLCGRSRDRKEFAVSRLIAATFICAPFAPADEVNHVDGVKTNDSAANLEWVTRAENMRHMREVLGRRPGLSTRKAVERVSESGEVKFYESQSEAARDGFLSSGISMACTGKKRTHRGFAWRFAQN